MATAKSKPSTSPKTPSAPKASKKAAEKAATKAAEAKPATKKTATKAAPKQTATKAPGLPLAKKLAKKAAPKAAPEPAPKAAPAKRTDARRAAHEGASDDAPATKPVLASELQIGAKAPPFELLGDDGARHSLRSYAGQRFVLYFYPKDDTPGCTKEACQFSELPGFEQLGIPVLGVSADSIESHRKFRAKYRLTVALLSDPGNTVALQYGAYGEKLLYGKPVVGTKRSTFLIGADGRIEKIWRNVRADGHAAEVLAALAK